MDVMIMNDDGARAASASIADDDLSSTNSEAVGRAARAVVAALGAAGAPAGVYSVTGPRGPLAGWDGVVYGGADALSVVPRTNERRSLDAIEYQVTVGWPAFSRLRAASGVGEAERYDPTSVVTHAAAELERWRADDVMARPDGDAMAKARSFLPVGSDASWPTIVEAAAQEHIGRKRAEGERDRAIEAGQQTGALAAFGGLLNRAQDHTSLRRTLRLDSTAPWDQIISEVARLRAEQDNVEAALDAQPDRVGAVSAVSHGQNATPEVPDVRNLRQHGGRTHADVAAGATVTLTSPGGAERTLALGGSQSAHVNLGDDGVLTILPGLADDDSDDPDTAADHERARDLVEREGELGSVNRRRVVTDQERSAGPESSAWWVRAFLRAWQAKGRGDDIISTEREGVEHRLTCHHLERLLVAATTLDDDGGRGARPARARAADERPLPDRTVNGDPSRVDYDEAMRRIGVAVGIASRTLASGKATRNGQAPDYAVRNNLDVVLAVLSLGADVPGSAPVWVDLTPSTATRTEDTTGGAGISAYDTIQRIARTVGAEPGGSFAHVERRVRRAAIEAKAYRDRRDDVTTPSQRSLLDQAETLGGVLDEVREQLQGAPVTYTTTHLPTMVAQLRAHAWTASNWIAGLGQEFADNPGIERGDLLALLRGRIGEGNPAEAAAATSLRQERDALSGDLDALGRDLAAATETMAETRAALGVPDDEALPHYALALRTVLTVGEGERVLDRAVSFVQSSVTYRSVLADTSRMLGLEPDADGVEPAFDVIVETARTTRLRAEATPAEPAEDADEYPRYGHAITGLVRVLGVAEDTPPTQLMEEATVRLVRKAGEASVWWSLEDIAEVVVSAGLNCAPGAEPPPAHMVAGHLRSTLGQLRRGEPDAPVAPRYSVAYAVLAGRIGLPEDVGSTELLERATQELDRQAAHPEAYPTEVGYWRGLAENWRGIALAYDAAEQERGR